MSKRYWLVPCLLALSVGARAQTGSAADEPSAHVFASPGGVDLKAYVFSSARNQDGELRPAIILFHGGGWTIGEPSWAFGLARHFAGRGLVAVAAQYRLSDHRSVTPIEAMADARAVIRWVRSQAKQLGVDPKRIAAYGWSAGGHLATCAAIFDRADGASQQSPAPNALILVSPAVSVTGDGWFQRLLGNRGRADDFSPDEHVREGLPPTLILQGDLDTVTPLAGVKRFCELMRAARNRCEMRVFEGYGHLFTPAGTPDDGWPKPDKATQDEALATADRFLQSLGYTK